MLLHHIYGLFTHPREEWQDIEKERSDNKVLYQGYVAILALVPVVCGYIGTVKVGWTIGNDELVRLSPDSGLILCSLSYMALLVSIFILGKLIDWIGKTYGADIDEKHPRGMSLASYAMTPLFLAGAVAIYPSITLNMLVVLAAMAYTVYLIYTGVPVLMHISAERGFLFASSIITMVLVTLVGVRVATVIIWVAFFPPVYQ
ncbi:MAG: Yip1 family protein [Pseudomonadales bacterium]|jgi:hypothetical protein